MNMKRFFEYDTVSLDAAKIEEKDDPIHGAITVFKDVVISREIIHAYTDGIAYKPAEELQDAAWTAEGMWAIAGGHPKDAVIMDRDEIHGRTVNARFSKSLIDPKTKRPNNKGIVADLEIFNNKVAPEILADMKAGKRHDVSIGFFFHRDETPGTISEDGHPLNGGVYDYVQRKMTINHTAFALEAGRCPMPFCGVGADEIGRHIANDPFAGFKNFAECLEKNKDKDDPKAFCGAIKAKSEKKDMFEIVLKNIKSEIDIVLSKFEDLEELKRDEGETIVDESMSDQEDLSGLLSFFRLTPENWGTLLDETRIILRSRWTELKKYYKDGDLEKMAGGEGTPVDAVLQQDVGDCLDCDEDEKKINQIANDLSLEEIDAKLKELKETRDGFRERVRVLEDALFTDPPAEKKRKRDLRNQINQLWDEMSDLSDEIRAFTEAKAIKITRSALADDEGKCPKGQVWNTEHNKCVKADEADEPEAKTVPFKATKSIEELLDRQ